MSSAAFGAEASEAWLDDRRRGKSRLLRNYENKLRRALNTFSRQIARIKRLMLRNMFMALGDLYSIRNGLLLVLARDFYEAP
jgi:hypothetical protein